jgi:NitT/TauT family transport system permease protein
VTATVGRGVREWFPAALVLVAGIGLWEAVVKGANVQRFILPAPSTIWTAFTGNQGALWHEGWTTFQEALGGFAIGCTAGIVFAVIVARWDLLGAALLPFAVAANAVPIIAFAPITNAWFNPLTKTSHMVIAAVLCFFPVFVNTVRGLTSVRPASIELMRSYAAGEIDIFRRVRFPTALPFIFTALKIATVLSMIGAIVGEYFGGSPEALGVLINSRNATFDFEEAWAGIGVACAFGIAFYLVVAALERLALRGAASTED